MRIYGRVAIALAIAGINFFGATIVSCSGGDDASSASDASTDAHLLPDVVQTVDDAGGPVVCAPGLPADYAHPYAPPRNAPTACTPAQVQSYWDQCLGTSSTNDTCTTFFGAPANSPCLACLDSKSTDSTYGTLVDVPNGTSVANLAGCIALIDGDSSDAGCGAKYEAYQFCKIDACETNCPVDSTNAASFTAFNNCEDDAGGTVCAAITAAATCGADAKYARCKFASYEAYIVGIGNIMCASAFDGGIADGGDGG
jgi:hypothetical protein